MTTTSTPAGQDRTPDVAVNMLTAALQYAALGWQVFPVVPNEKDPLQYGNGPKGIYQATDNPDTIRALWEAYPDANIGVHLAASGLVVVDLDTYKAEGAQAAGELPPTLTQISARGGQHAFYRAEDGASYSKNGSINVDVKHRGYVLVYPSTFEGGTYQWQDSTGSAGGSSGPDLSRIQPAPQWLKRQPREKPVGDAQQGTTGRTLAEVQEALTYISPNMPYDDWLQVLMAIHDEFGDAGVQIADEWSERGATYQDGLVDRKFGTFKRGDGVTVAHVFKLAADKGCDLAALSARHRQLDIASLFSVVPVEEFGPNLFEIAAAAEQEAYEGDVYELLTPGDLRRRPPPQFLIADHIPQNSLGFLYSRPGVGKTFMALDMSLTIAAGLGSWNGYAVHLPVVDGVGVGEAGGLSVLYIASEGSFDLSQRIEAWRLRHGVGVEALEGFRVLEASVNFMDGASVEKLLRSVGKVGGRPALVVVDTVSRALPGADENLQKDMTLFIAACDRIRQQYQCAVMGLHHASKSGTALRGSSVIEGAGDFIMLMERDKTSGLVGEMTMLKQKAASDGWSYPFVLEPQVLAFSDAGAGGVENFGPNVFGSTTNNIGDAGGVRSSLVWRKASPSEASAALTAQGGAEAAEQAAARALAGDYDEGAVMAAIDQGAGQWRDDARSPQWAGHAIAVALKVSLSDADQRARVRAIMQDLVARGVCRVDISLDEKRRPRRYYVRAGGMSESHTIFD